MKIDKNENLIWSFGSVKNGIVIIHEFDHFFTYHLSLRFKWNNIIKQLRQDNFNKSSQYENHTNLNKVKKEQKNIFHIQEYQNCTKLNNTYSVLTELTELKKLKSVLTEPMHISNYIYSFTSVHELKFVFV